MWKLNKWFCMLICSKTFGKEITSNWHLWRHFFSPNWAISLENLSDDMQIMISASCKCLLLLIALVIEVFLMTHFIISLVITYRYKLFIANKYIFMKNFLSCAIKKLILYRKMLFLVAFKQPYLFEEAGHRHCLYFFGFFFFHWNALSHVLRLPAKCCTKQHLKTKKSWDILNTKKNLKISKQLDVQKCWVNMICRFMLCIMNLKR